MFTLFVQVSVVKLGETHWVKGLGMWNFEMCCALESGIQGGTISNLRQLCVERILKGALFVGHVKTDLDSIAGAIGGACLWQGTATRAERDLNGEIMYALKWAGRVC